MKLLLRFVLVAGMVWLAFELGWPWVSRQFEGSGLHRRAGGDGGGACLDAVESAISQFGESLVDHLRPPVDLDRWSDTLAAAEESAVRSRDTCRCDQAPDLERDACAAALAVIDELEAFHRHADDTLRGGAPPVDFARRQQDLQESLERARRR